MELFTKRFLLEKVDGTFVELSALSIKNAMEYEEAYKKLAKLLNEPEFKGLNIMEAYMQNAKFKFYVDKIFSLFGKDISALDIAPANLFALLFPHENEDGSYSTVGLLTEFALGLPEKGNKVAKEVVDQYASTLADLLILLNNFNDSIAVLEHLSPKDLTTVLEQYAEKIKTPDQKHKEKMSEQLNKLKEELHGKIEAMAVEPVTAEQMSEDEVMRLMNGATKQ